jgi:predicted acylesterase/phospholipase RssA
MARLTLVETRETIKKRAAKKEKLALVLAGGGITGATYEIGALQALDRCLAGEFSVTDFDIIVGSSAGAFVGSLLANGVKPAEMFFALDAETRTIEKMNQLDFFYPNFSEVIARPLSFLPSLIYNGLKQLIKTGDLNSLGHLESLNQLLPSGIFSNERIERYLNKVLSQDGRTNDFQRLKKELYIAATDLDTGERVIFGDGEHRDTPISKTVQASTALPVFYKPVKINDREYTDGAIRKSLHIDVALKRGADLVVCINPLVPLYNDLEQKAIPLVGGPGTHLSERGLVYIAHQVLRILVHSRISSGLEKYRRFYPQVDILLIEPRADDYEMFFFNIMNYSARVSIARHGYEETLEAILTKFAAFKRHLARHGIEICQRGIRSELNRIRDVPLDSYGEIERILYPAARRRKTPSEKLRQTLNALEAGLNDWSMAKRRTA